MAMEKTKRSGVALIVVLGLVAILMIVSVTFTIHMRVERAGAANLRHAAIARQLVKGGLAGALMAIDLNAGNSSAPQWYDSQEVTSLTYHPPFSKTSYLWRDTLVSYPTNSGAEHIPAVLFSGEAERYFPAGLAYRGYATRYSPPDNTDGSKWRNILQPHWIPVFADTGNDNVMGRYAFFALDTTGMLDASCMTNSSNSRWMGRDPGEMDVSLLPDVKNAQEFAKANSKNGTYETLAEFSAMNQYVSDCRSFNTFSDDPGPTNELVYIGGSAAEIRAHKDDIIEAFERCGLTASSHGWGKNKYKGFSEQACWAYLGLVDYVDSDGKMEVDSDIPIKPWERPATEKMPLLSGFFAKLTVEATHERTRPEEGTWNEKKPLQVKLKADVRIPFVYSFVKDMDSDATLKGKATLIVSGLFDPGTNKKKRVIKNGSQSKTMDEEFILDNVAVDYTDPLNVVQEGSDKSLADQLKLTSLRAKLQVGGATYIGGELQHCFPAIQSEFSRDDSAFSEEGYGMVAEILGGSDVSFSEDTPTSSNSKTDPTTHVETQTRIWETNILVWAEIVDPRFSSQSVADFADEIDGDIMRSLFKVSHVDYDNGSGLQFISLRDLKNRVDAFSGFTDAETFASKKFEDAWGKNRRGVGSDFGWYFGWQLDLTPAGTGPLAAYLLKNPAAVEALYDMPMDGIQKGSNAADTDIAWIKHRMHVADEPLQSVGELGYLPIGMWQTIRLYDYWDDFGKPAGNNKKTSQEILKFSAIPEDDGGGYFHPVLDHFSVIEEDVSVRGRVNLNTLNQDILATAFHNMPIASEDGNKSTAKRIDRGITKRTDMHSLTCLAKAIVEHRNDAGGFTKLSDLGYLFGYGEDLGDLPVLQGAKDNKKVSYPARAVANAAGTAAWGEFERESVVRNSCGLFTLRGQTFIVVVRAESYSPPFGRKKSIKDGTSNASKTAIAEVWRDSIPDANGKHPMYVKFFKIIDD